MLSKLWNRIAKLFRTVLGVVAGLASPRGQRRRIRLKCCVACFEHAEVQQLVRDLGEMGDSPCDYCDEMGLSQVETEALQPVFRRLVDREYVRTTDLTQGPHIDAFEEGEDLQDLLEVDHGPLFAAVDSRDLICALLGDDEDAWEWDADLFSRAGDDLLEWDETDYWSDLNSDIRKLGHSALRSTTFVGTDKGKDAYEVILESLKRPLRTVSMDSDLWRARLGSFADPNELRGRE
jgi:hypothetical protein